MGKNKTVKKEPMYIEFQTRLLLDHLTYGWMCPVCEKVYAHEHVRVRLDSPSPGTKIEAINLYFS